MTVFKDLCILFLFGAVGYCLIEILWRGHTHPSMAIVGGICFILIYIINKYLPDNSCVTKAILCALVISAIEFSAGILLNIVMQLDVWDYSKIPFNLMGQICLRYSVLWFFLSFGIIHIGNSFFGNVMTAFL